MLTFSDFLEAFRGRIDSVVSQQRKLNRLNKKIGTSGEDHAAAAHEKYQFLRDRQAKKTAALHKMLKARGKK